MTRGVVPFENSTNGSVVYTLDLFADRQNAYPDICVAGEAYLDVHHFLLGHEAAVSAIASPIESGGSTPTLTTPRPSHARTKPMRSLKHIKRLYSHPQAFGQCEIFLSANLKGIERHEVSSTSKAAEIVAKDGTQSSAAIASEIAAKIQKLAVLAEGIEDREDNTTRFFTLKRMDDPEIEQAQPPKHQHQHQHQHYKTLVAFTIDHLSPGALADALNVFKAHGLNLTSINSRPSRIAPWHYIFFVEFQGGKTVDLDGSVKAAFQELERVAKAWRWLGSWPDESRR